MVAAQVIYYTVWSKLWLLSLEQNTISDGLALLQGELQQATYNSYSCTVSLVPTVITSLQLRGEDHRDYRSGISSSSNAKPTTSRQQTQKYNWQKYSVATAQSRNWFKRDTCNDVIYFTCVQFANTLSSPTFCFCLMIFCVQPSNQIPQRLPATFL